MRFKEWLFKEVGTTTGDVAVFSRISIPMSRRMWPPCVATMFDQSPPGEKKKKIVNQPQVQESRTFLTTQHSNRLMTYYDLNPEQVVQIVNSSARKNMGSNYGAWLYDNKVCLWDRDEETHDGVATQMGIDTKQSLGFYIGSSSSYIIKNENGDNVYKWFVINNSNWSGSRNTNFENTDFGKSVLKIVDSYARQAVAV